MVLNMSFLAWSKNYTTKTGISNRTYLFLPLALQSFLSLPSRNRFLRRDFYRLVLIYIFAPTLILRHFAANQIVIHILDFTRHLARLAIANLAVVDLTQANHFCCRTADKDLIRNIELVA